MKKTLVLTATALLLLTATATVTAADQPPKPSTSRRVIMVVANGITTADLLDDKYTPNINRSFKNRAALGLMNTRAARKTTNMSSSYLSIGVGARANAGTFGNLAFGEDEAVRFDGVPVELPSRSGGEIVSPGFPEMSRAATKLSYQALPGTLGDLLRAGGVKRAVFGNADSLGDYHREVNLIAMDARGSTDFGNVAEQINSPERALAVIDRGLKKSRFVVVEYAPTTKIDLHRDFLTNQEVASKRRKRLAEVDKIFGSLLERYEPTETMVILIAPAPAVELAKSGALQTPLVVAGPGYRGLLTSAGTRWPGMVANNDIAPTVLTFFRLPVPLFFSGRPLGSEPAADPPVVIDRIAQKSLINYSTRSFLLSGYITAIVIAIIAVAAGLLLWPRAGRLALFQPLLLSLMFIPVVMLISNTADYASAVLPVLLIPLAALLSGGATWLVLRRRPLSALLVPNLLTAAVVLVQLPLSSVLERNSVMGMSSIIGARYYGIGNEYGGILLAAATMCLALVLSLKPRTPGVAGAAAAAVFVILTLIIGLPALGANVGCALAAVTTGIVAVLLLRGTRLAAKHLFLVLLGLCAVVAVILLSDYASSSASHAGRAATLVGSSLSQAVTIITRKLLTNFTLITHSSWTKIIFAAAAAVIALRAGARLLYDRVSKDYKTMQTGFVTIALGATAALVFNDSGVVAAALMVVYAIGGWLYLMVFSALAPEPPKP